MLRSLAKFSLRVVIGAVLVIWLLGSCGRMLDSLVTPTASPTPSTTASGAEPVRLLPAVHAKRNRNFTLMTGIDGARWDPCLPVHYVVNPANQPAGGLKAIQKTMAVVSQATGLKFVYDGKTREHYSATRADYQPTRYPGQWAPVLVSWETDKQFNRDLRASGEGSSVSRVVGWGGPQAITLGHAEWDPAESYIITGSVTLRASYLGQLLRSGNGAQARAVILHEMGHVVGLDHVKSASQVMNATSTATKLGAGDRYGFAYAGSGQCATLARRPVPHALN